MFKVRTVSASYVVFCQPNIRVNAKHTTDKQSIRTEVIRPIKLHKLCCFKKEKFLEEETMDFTHLSMTRELRLLLSLLLGKLKGQKIKNSIHWYKSAEYFPNGFIPESALHLEYIAILSRLNSKFYLLNKLYN